MSSDGFAIDTQLAFDEQKQAAILGWCLIDPLFCSQAMLAIKPEWFSSPYVAKLFAGLSKVYHDYSRRAHPLELLKMPPFSQEDQPTQKKYREAGENALKQTKIYGLDILRDELTTWMHAILFHQGMERAIRLYNGKKLKEAWQVVEDAALMRSTSSFEEGTSQGFESAAARILDEKEERLRQAPKIIPYGVTFLDDALGGIIPNDLIVLGAKSGKGKTTLATAIALAVSKLGHKVHYFALEAERFEIERRIKYGLLSSAYYQAGNKLPIDYSSWRQGRLEEVLGPLEKRLEGEFVEAVKNLQTLYRNTGTFDLKALEKNLTKAVQEGSRLVIVDHLHYVDTDDDENFAYKKTIKMIRDAVLRYDVPVIVIAHLRKEQGRGSAGASLINTMEDFHGTSDVPKIATTCIMIAPAWDRQEDPTYEPPLVGSWYWPTYIGVVKSRLEGSRTRFTAVTQFNSRTSLYEPVYQIGKMVEQNKVWEELTGNDAPYWVGRMKSGSLD